MDTAHTFHAIFLRHHDVREQLGLVEGCSRRVPLEGLQDLVVLEVVLDCVVDVGHLRDGCEIGVRSV